MSTSLKNRLKELFPTDNPKEASRDTSGAVEARKPDPKERTDGDMIPVVAVLVGVVILAVAFLRPQRLNLAPSAAPQSEMTEDNFATDWPQTEQGY